MRKWLTGLTLLALGIPAIAQDAAETKKKTDSTPAKKIVPSGETKKAPAKELSEGQKKFQEIQMDSQRLQEEVIKEYRAAKPEDQKKMLTEVRAKLDKIRAGSAQKAFDLIKTLDEKDPVSTTILQYASAMDPNSSGKIEALANESKSKSIKGTANLILGQKSAEAAENPKLAKGQVEELQKKAASYFEIVMKDFADVPARKSTLGQAAKGALNELKYLKIGMPALEVTCLNIDGDKEDKLSNYKGKVVVLDIWATWCGPCRAMIPHENEMVAKLKGKKFALISVSADDEKKTLVNFLEKTKMPWTHWFAESKGILQDWNIRYYPTIYVIDHKGVIRAKDLRGEKLEEKVNELLAEMEKEKVS